MFSLSNYQESSEETTTSRLPYFVWIMSFGVSLATEMVYKYLKKSDQL